MSERELFLCVGRAYILKTRGITEKKRPSSRRVEKYMTLPPSVRSSRTFVDVYVYVPFARYACISSGRFQKILEHLFVVIKGCCCFHKNEVLNLCIGCCSCEMIAPEVFTIDKNTKSNPKSRVYNKKGAKNQKIINAAETCPTKAIIVDNLDENRRVYPY